MPIGDLRLFVDEVGNSDLKGAATDPNVRYLALSGILTTADLHTRIITPRLDAVKACLADTDRHSPVVLHRRDIVRREGVFACLRDPALADEFDKSLYASLKEMPYLVTTVQIDKKAHLDAYSVWHYDPYHYCLRCLVERFVLYARRHQSNGIVVIEPRYKKSDKKLKASYEMIYKQGTENIPATTVQKHLLSKDLVFSPKSANVAGLQLADLIAHPSARQMRFARDGLPLPDDFGGRVATLLTEAKYARNPKNHVIEGYGLKWLP